MKDPSLKTDLRSLVDRYGIERVSREVDKIAVSARRATDGKHVLDRATRENDRQKPRTTTPEYVGKMDISPDRRTAMLALAARFDEKSFLPAWADIRHFCEMYGIETPASKSRAGAIPRVFKFLAGMEPGELEKLLDRRAFSGPSRLGPIAEAIRQHGRAARGRRDEPSATAQDQGPRTTLGAAPLPRGGSAT